VISNFEIINNSAELIGKTQLSPTTIDSAQWRILENSGIPEFRGILENSQNSLEFPGIPGIP
jgi:hypothetical protein